MDYRAAVAHLLSMATPVGDVIPFRKRGMYPELMGTEGGGRGMSGGGGRGFNIDNFRGVKPISPEEGKRQDKLNQTIADLTTNYGFSPDRARYTAALLQQQGWPKGNWVWDGEQYNFEPE